MTLEWSDRAGDPILWELGRSSRLLLKEAGCLFAVDGGVARANVVEARKSDQRSRGIICSILTALRTKNGGGSEKAKGCVLTKAAALW